MNGKRIGVALLVSLVLAIVVTVAVARLIDSRRRRDGQPQHYVAASENIAAGQVVKASDLKMISWTSPSTLPGGFTSIKDVAGRIAIYPIGTGEPVMTESLAKPGSGFGLVGKIPLGMRAIAIKTDDVSGVDGFLFPGCHVDILVTSHGPFGSGYVTNTVLQDVTVLAAGHQTEPDPQGKPITVSVVTVLVSPSNAQKIALATAEGQIHFVLRNGADTANVSGPAMMTSQLVGQPPTPEPAYRPTPFRRPYKPVVRYVKPVPTDAHYINTYLGGEQKVETTKF